MKGFIRILVIGLMAVIALSAQTPVKMFYQDIAFSPDGKYISSTSLHDFVKGDGGPGESFKTDIYVCGSDGSAPRRITDDSKNEFYTSMSKTRVVYGAGTPGMKASDLYTANYDGSDIRQVTKDAGSNTAPAFSPNGQQIAFVSTRDAEKYQIYVMNADGSHVVRLTNDPAVGFFNPQWSPDGRRLVFYTEKGDQKDQVWTMRADGSEMLLVTANVGHNIFPGWSHDGRKILFSSSRRDTDQTGSYTTGSYLYTINVDGSGLTKLADIKSFFVRASPDGKQIAFIQGGFPDSSIFVANRDGSDIRKITK